jgi:hypothetical protein
MLRPSKALAACAVLCALATMPRFALADGMQSDSMHGDAMHGDAMHGTAIDCNDAHAAMLKLMNPPPAAAFTGSPSLGTDVNFASAMSLLEKQAQAVAKIELQCGKDSKAKAAAQKVLDEGNAMQQEFDSMKHTP